MSKLQIRVLYPMSHYLFNLIQQLRELAGPHIRIVTFNPNKHVKDPQFNVDILIKGPTSDALMDDFVDVIVSHQASPSDIFNQSRKALFAKMQALQTLVTNAKEVLDEKHFSSMQIV